MNRAKCAAVAFAVATFAVVRASQCSSGGDCPIGSRPNSGVSLLQKPRQTNVFKDGDGGRRSYRHIFKNTSTDDLVAGAFRDAFEEVDRRIFYELLDVFANVSRRSGVSYSLFYGSLFGQHCVGDQLAWDDDGDLVVYGGWERLADLADGLGRRLLGEYGGRYRIAWDPQYGRTNMKLYSVEGKPKLGRPKMPWLAPFLDISHLPCSELTCRQVIDTTSYNRDDIFPIRYAAFGRSTQPIPARPRAVLRARYTLPPCTEAFPVGWDHFLEMDRPATVVKPFMRGIPFELVSRRLSDSICAQSYPGELPSISLDRRSIYAAQAGSVPATMLNRDICKELHSIVVNNSISKWPPSRASSVAMQDIKVVLFNMQRGAHWKESLDHLRGANIIMLNEVDVGMARTGNIDVTRELALELGKNYVQAIEFVELSSGLPAETRPTANTSNKNGFHCNAILSDFPLHSPRITRLPGAEAWFKAPAPPRTEVRLGSRMVLLSRVVVGEQPVWVAVTHLDGTDDQLDASAEAVGRDSAPGPMIYAGDLHAGMHGVQRRFGATGLRFDASSGAPPKPARGHATDGGKVTSRGGDHTHLVGARGVKISAMAIQAPVGPDGELVSDGAFVAFNVGL
mmetsp:Transcript_11149/g.31549  ORF Transcript_11149/g.31549 Transcript_11149/m.31549 type:complete len:623 (-) Transcript_11149:20-1888(-)